MDFFLGVGTGFIVAGIVCLIGFVCLLGLGAQE